MGRTLIKIVMPYFLLTDLGAWVWNKIPNNFIYIGPQGVTSFGWASVSALQGIKCLYHSPYPSHDSHQLEWSTTLSVSYEFSLRPLRNPSFPQRAQSGTSMLGSGTNRNFAPNSHLPSGYLLFNWEMAPVPPPLSPGAVGEARTIRKLMYRAGIMRQKCSLFKLLKLASGMAGTGNGELGSSTRVEISQSSYGPLGTHHFYFCLVLPNHLLCH